jgi:hypothetical protein
VIVIDGARVVDEGPPHVLESRPGPFRDLFGHDTLGPGSSAGNVSS